MKGINKIRDQIETAIEISLDSGVPILLLANPGSAKSTIVQNWARRRGYHTETLIGSRFSQEEILGFQVRVENENREQRLELLEPHWYRNILEFERQGIPSLLFLDELSTTQENVQGTLLQLIFERTIGHGKKLPQSTLVIAAANYKRNIPFQFNIMAPILNRFCIVNLKYDNSESFLNEFLQETEDWEKDLPEFSCEELSTEDRERLRRGIKTLLRTLFVSFEIEGKDQEGNAIFTMDINNQNYAGIYDGESESVYNFITGRTISYLYQVSQSFLRKGLSMAKHGGIMINIVNGLIGRGTNTFEDKQQQEYLNSLSALYGNLFTTLETGEEQRLETLDFSGKNVADAIQEWILYHESSVLHHSSDPNLPTLTAHIERFYGKDIQDVEKLRQKISLEKMEGYAFTNDFQRLDYLIRFMEMEPEMQDMETGDSDGNEMISGCLARLREIRDRYEELRREMMERIAGFA